jgi:2-succinyl-6-hydroxy-2,4-cyclohexadiene-1-carboxylate synthase
MTEIAVQPWRALSGPLGGEQLGPDEAPRLVFVHGFTQTSESWKPIAEHLVVHHGVQAIVVDLPGHGRSANVRADLRRIADMLASMGGNAVYIGYSLGGRACLHLALMYPHLVRRLVLIGTNPGIEDDEERAERRASDDALAGRILELGVPAFLAEWTTMPLFGGTPLPEAELADRGRNTPEGLANSLRMAGTGAQGSLWPRLRELAMPVLALAGADDHKFAAIAEQIATAAPRGRYVTIAGAAHAAHQQQPDAVIAAIDEWLPWSRL